MALPGTDPLPVDRSKCPDQEVEVVMTECSEPSVPVGRLNPHV